MKGAAGEEFADEKKKVCELYNEIDGYQLNVQLESLVTYFHLFLLQNASNIFSASQLRPSLSTVKYVL